MPALSLTRHPNESIVIGDDDRGHGGVTFAYKLETCFFDDGTPFGILV